MKRAIVVNRVKEISRLFVLDKRFLVVKGGLCKYSKKILGVGGSRMNYLMAKTGIGKAALLSDLSISRVASLSEYGRRTFIFERELQAALRQNIFEKNRNGSYVGIRMKQGLPTRGQRTRSNARTTKRKRSS